MSIFTKIFGMFDKLDDIIYEPVKLITDWAREPLKGIENRRQKNLASHLAQIEMQKEEHRINMEIKRETGVKKVLAELDEWQKDKQLVRTQELINSIAAYKERLVNLNIEAHKAIGNLEFELQEKAKKLVYENTVKYIDLQEKARESAFTFLERIENFKGNEKTKEKLEDQVLKMLSNIIDNADDFVKTLNGEMIDLSKSISQLTHSGEKFINEHIQQISIITTNNVNKIGNGKDNISDAEYVE